jgi:hypothetical protein
MATRKRHGENVKRLAARLRARGATYAHISATLAVPKSTLSTWFGESMQDKFSSNTWLEHLKKARVLAAAARRSARLESERAIEARARKLLIRTPYTSEWYVKSLLGMLYWAEGARRGNVSGVRFTNTDARMIRLFLTLYRLVYSVTPDQVRLQVQCHPYHDSGEVRTYWASVADVPEERVTIQVVPKRGLTKRYRKNFAGICQLRLPNVDRRREIMTIAYELELWYRNVHWKKG